MVGVSLTELEAVWEIVGCQKDIEGEEVRVGVAEREKDSEPLAVRVC